MLVPIRWLRDYVEIDASAQELAARLNDSGVEIASVSTIGAHWEPDKIVVGQIISIDPHPNADRLTLPTVDTGGAEVRIVTGASNIQAGDKVPFAMEGASLVDPRKNDGSLMKLRAASIRGVASRGMVCSPLELGLSDDHEGILILPEDAPVGVPLIDFMGGDVIELDMKPNRADCLAMLGVARQAAALYGRSIAEPDTGRERNDRSVLPDLKIEIEDPGLCARYSAAYMYDVAVGESPVWLRTRLEQAGVRPINNIVDITNFVMLEMGQPLHAFDWAKLTGNFIGVRSARAGETLTTLDGQERELDPENLLIVDGEGAVGLAGVLGGLETEITNETTEILLESANFAQTSIRRTSRGLGLRSEASRRFEQRLSPETTVHALRRAVQLAEEIGAAKGVEVWEDSYPAPREIPTVDFPLSEVPRLLGIDFPEDDVIDTLARAGFEVEKSGEGMLKVTPPYWRGDVTMKADLVEEVVSLIGFEAIPSTLPTGGVTDVVPGELDPREQALRDVLAAAGFQEAITYTITSTERMGVLVHGGTDDGAFDDLGTELAELLLSVPADAIELVNPLRSEQNVMRTTALPSLLETLSANLRFTKRDAALFEIGPIFMPHDGDLPDERRVLTVISGAWRSELGWDDSSEVDFFAMKGVAELVLDRLGLSDSDYKPFRHPAFRVGSCAVIVAGGHLIGAVGEVDPAVRAAVDIDETAWAFVLDLRRSFERAADVRSFRSLPRFPAIVQDLSIVVGTDVPSADIVATIRKAGRALVDDVRIVDQYRGEQVPEDKRGLTYSITYRSPERTLVDREAANCHQRILRALQARFGATLRT
ncbi:MAG: phenylalanine--tRNA ligase subunit beta [Chloroflexi bacterium]|nr:phenylalanine--tRNA ligase subunit beta [Chloroflexota bacterium]MCY3937429.1 phenylalanine--tRNA ligase subunit beta [Chloroflexota bacterium]